MKSNVKKRILALLLCGMFAIQPITAVQAKDSLQESTSERKEANPIVSFSIDKKIMSEGETATITIEMAEGYSAKYFSFNRPVTDKTDVVSLSETSEGIYTGTFKVTDQTQSGVWEVRYLTYTETGNDNLMNYLHMYNSNNYTGTYYETMDFSPLDFEVVGTNADVTAPKLKNYMIDKKVVSQGEKITITVNIEDEHLPTSSADISLQYDTPSDNSESIFFKKVDDTGLYEAVYNITDQTEKGIWKPHAFRLRDANENFVTIYNSATNTYAPVKEDLSSLNFEVIDANGSETPEQEEFIVIFKDGYGNTLSTQKVAKGEAAVEPEKPTHELYLFDGWDSEFTNITSNKVINATWKLNPDAKYDEEAHVGKSFKIEVYSKASQDYTITCNEDIDFTSNLVGSGMIFLDQLYYYKDYEIQVNDIGSYLFYVKGSKGSNVLSYKVRITDHTWDTEWTTDKEATCTEKGSKSHHCTGCDEKADITEIPVLEHDFSGSEYVVKAPTCTESGIKEVSCRNANCDAKKEVVIPAKGHRFGEWIVVEEATYEKEGKEEKTCNECFTKETRTIPKKVATSVEFDKNELELKIADTYTLKVSCLPENPSDYREIHWTSDNKSVATVNERGKITAVSDGTAVITATVGDKTAQCIVTVLIPDGWKLIDDNWYYYENGKKVTGWKEINGKYYYMYEDGKMASDTWIDGCYVDKSGVWIKNKKPAGWVQSGSKWWYRNEDGTYPASCWKQIDGSWYYFDGSGYRVTGWRQIGGKWYYMGTNGVMATGWQKIGGSWYYFSTSGVMQTGWLQLGGIWYYCNSSGVMQTGWLKLGNAWYYFKGDGSMLANEMLNETYYFKANGAMATGWQKIGGTYYYFSGSGAKVTNQWVGDYYLKANGTMATNEWIGDYYVGADGKWIPGYSETNGNVYWTPGGKSYHNSKDCTALKRSTDIRTGTLDDAKANGKKDPCNLCVK